MDSDRNPAYYRIGVTYGNVDSSIQRLAITNNPVNTVGKFPDVCDMRYVYSDNSEVFIGAVPPQGNPAISIRGESQEYVPVQFYTGNTSLLPKLSPGQLLLKNGENSQIKFDIDPLGNTINLGNEISKITIDAQNDLVKNTITNLITDSYAIKKITGEVKREIKPNEVSLTLKGDNSYYYTKLDYVCLDPTNKNKIVGAKNLPNPAFIENREIIYEFPDSVGIKDLNTEAKKYSTNRDGSTTDLDGNSDRRVSPADTLSLSLTAPNYLMETVKGTVVDIFGNVLDLNRYPIKPESTLSPDSNTSNLESYLNIRAEERRSLAFHFEINARKDIQTEIASLDGKSATKVSAGLPDYNSTKNHARDRSRFFIDIDKEGQFKINVPASSESGNIPLLTRYENFSTVNDPENPNKLVRSPSNLDIVHDSFASGISNQNINYKNISETIQSNNGYNRGVVSIKKKEVDTMPIERLLQDGSPADDSQPQVHIKYGTAYHDISATCVAFQDSKYANYLIEKPDLWDQQFNPLAIKNPIVTNEIKIGENAGGRSGSINLDGFIDFNIGANTIDKQSMWLDTEGGIIANIGKDKNDISAAINMDGNLFLQVGGFGPQNSNSEQTYTSGAVEIRVVTPQYNPVNQKFEVVIIRVDNQGVNIVSPNNISILAKQDINIKSSANISIESSNLKLNGRLVERPDEIFDGTV